MGNCCPCLQPKEPEASWPARDPILDAEARRAAAEAAESRQRAFEASAQGRAVKRVTEAAAREKKATSGRPHAVAHADWLN